MHWKSPISAASVTSLCGRCVHATFKKSLGLKPGGWGTLQNEVPCFRMWGAALCCHVPWGVESVSSDRLEAPFLQMLWGSWGAGNGAVLSDLNTVKDFQYDPDAQRWGTSALPPQTGSSNPKFMLANFTQHSLHGPRRQPPREAGLANVHCECPSVWNVPLLL